MQIITIFDFLLLPIYLAIFFFFIKKKAATYSDVTIRKIFFISFGLRMLGSVGYCLLVQYYYGFGDSFTFYQGSSFIHEQLVQNSDNIKYLFASTSEFQQWFDTAVGDKNLSGYLGIASSNAVMKISAMISFIAFNKYMIISLFFGLFSFAGQWKLFQVFNDYNKGKNQTLLAYAVLYSPSIWFWGSGLMKDSICIGAVGFIIHILYTNIIKKDIRIKQWLYIPLLISLIYIIKSYIIFILLLAIAVVFFVRYVLQLKNILVRIAVILLFITSTSLIIFFSDFSSLINEFVQDSYLQVQSFQINYQNLQSEDETSKAGFELGNFDASLNSILLKSPGVILTVLFRPFLWESKKIIILLTSLESTMLLLVTIFLLFKTKILGFFFIIFSNPFVLFCFVTCILFALIIGFTTFNFGTMTRYKIILLPFFYFMLVFINNKSTEK